MKRKANANSQYPAQLIQAKANLDLKQHKRKKPVATCLSAKRKHQIALRTHGTSFVLLRTSPPSLDHDTGADPLLFPSSSCSRHRARQVCSGSTATKIGPTETQKKSGDSKRCKQKPQEWRINGRKTVDDGRLMKETKHAPEP